MIGNSVDKQVQRLSCKGPLYGLVKSLHYCNKSKEEVVNVIKTKIIVVTVKGKGSSEVVKHDTVKCIQYLNLY